MPHALQLGKATYTAAAILVNRPSKPPLLILLVKDSAVSTAVSFVLFSSGQRGVQLKPIDISNPEAMAVQATELRQYVYDLRRNCTRPFWCSRFPFTIVYRCGGSILTAEDVSSIRAIILSSAVQDTLRKEREDFIQFSDEQRALRLSRHTFAYSIP